MKKVLETKRLLLRELNPDDAAFFFQLNKNPNVIQYTGDSPFSSIQEARLFLENYKEYDVVGFGRWAVSIKRMV